jgi:ABC-type sugar transport system permease subunit
MEKEKRNFWTYRRKRQLSYWIMLTPFLIGFAVVYLNVYVNSLRFSFERIDLLTEGGFSRVSNGFQNFRYILVEDPNYRNYLSTSISEMILFTVFIVLFSLFIAVLLNRKMPGRGFFRAMFFIPVILATGFVARADMASMVMRSMQAGMESSTTASGSVSMFSEWDVMDILWSLGLYAAPLSGYAAMAANRIVEIINQSGVQILIFLAGLQSISPQIYESADIDGATGWESFWLITFPMISPLILVNIIYTIIDSLTRPTNLIMQLIDLERGRQGGASSGMGVASAMAWFYFLVIVGILAAATAITSLYVYYQQKD